MPTTTKVEDFKINKLTQEQYDASDKDPTAMWVITDQSSFYTKEETDDKLGDKQDVLTAGDNITIEDGVISSAGGDAMQIVRW